MDLLNTTIITTFTMITDFFFITVRHKKPFQAVLNSYCAWQNLFVVREIIEKLSQSIQQSKNWKKARYEKDYLAYNFHIMNLKWYISNMDPPTNKQRTNWIVHKYLHYQWGWVGIFTLPQ